MNLDVVTEVLIDRSCAEVSRFAADPDNARQWSVNFKEVQWQTERSLPVGARIRISPGRNRCSSLLARRNSRARRRRATTDVFRRPSRRDRCQPLAQAGLGRGGRYREGR
jgi:hypothetical protein